MRAWKRFAAVLPLGLMLVLGACGTTTLTAARGACKGYNPAQPPLIQDYRYRQNETQEHFAIPANSTLIIAVDDPYLNRGQFYDLYPAPAGGGTVKIPSGPYIVRIVVVANSNVKPALEWLIVTAYYNGEGVFKEYDQDTLGNNQLSPGVKFGLNPCVDHIDQE